MTDDYDVCICDESVPSDTCYCDASYVPYDYNYDYDSIA